MDNARHTPDRRDIEPDKEQGRASASIEGRGWDILVGGEENAAALGGDDPFDHRLPEDREADEVLGLASPGASPETARAGQPPRPDEVRPYGLSAGVAVELIAPVSESRAPLEAGSLGSEEPAAPSQPEPEPVVSASPKPLSPGVSVEVLSETPQAEFEVPAFSVEEFMAPPDKMPDVGPVPRPGAPPVSGGETLPPFIPFGDAAAEPFAPEPGAAPFGGEAPGAPTAPLVEPPVARAFDLARSRPYDPFEEEPPFAPTVTEEMPPDQELGALLITPERISALWDEINATYDLVISDVRGYYTATESALRDLKRARELLLAGEEHFDNAEELVKRVKARLRLEEKVRQWSRTRGAWLGVYLVIWLLLLSIAALTTNRFAELATQFVPDWMAAAFLPGLFGGLGGVVGALWVLLKHIVRKRDFDPIHTPWYVVNPFMGIALGVITYLLVRVSDALLTGDPLLVEGTQTLFGLYALCAIVGFKQNVLWSLADRVIKAILPSESTTPTVEEVSAMSQPEK